jgi:hypothetical protein
MGKEEYIEGPPSVSIPASSYVIVIAIVTHASFSREKKIKIPLHEQNNTLKGKRYKTIKYTTNSTNILRPQNESYFPVDSGEIETWEIFFIKLTIIL